jgi:hypothetical protein
MRACGRRLIELDQNGLSDCWQAGLRRWSWRPFFPARCFQAAGLEEGEGDHGHQRVSMEALP